jgi:hypothetical protein
MVINCKDPMTLSIVVGLSSFLLSILVLVLYKPRVVTKVKENEHTHITNRKLDWFKLIVLALIISLMVAIIVFMVLMKRSPDVIEYKKATMEFSKVY